jgi:stage V sporulation protein D (sporulation-specific penicillin-binding protein)
MASYPTFDLNNPRDLTPFYSSEEIAAMDEAEQMEALNQIWRNFCISDTYEPGSTAKPFTISAALENGDITGEETYNCTGMLHVGDHDIFCHNRLGDGLLNVQQGIMKSCNVVLMNVAFAMGTESWLKYNQFFNFGLKTNIDLSGEVNAASLVFDDAMNQTDLAVGSFGQGFNVTMIQMVSGFSALINGGYYYQPRMVNKILNADGASIEDIDARVLKQIISNTTSDRIREMCNSVVMSGEEGTGHTARPAGYTMGGKTGTAEKIPRDKKNYVVSFVGYVPADDPQVLIYVVIDQPNVAKQDNARYATLLVNDIMTEVLPYMNIFMTEELTEEEKAELAEKQLDFSLGSQGSISDNTLSGNAVSGNSVSKNSSNEAKEGQDGLETTTSENVVADRKITYDPETGYPIDPNTGQVLDPETLLPISGSTSFMN